MADFRPCLPPALALLAFVALTPTADAQQPGRRLDVPYVPTPQETVDRMLSMAQVGPNDFLIDLGSGDGRIVVTAAQRFGTRGFGVDIDPTRIAESKENAQKAGVSDKVDFLNQDLFKTEIAKATVLTMYLLPDVNMRLRPRVLDELKPGTRIVSHAFTMGDWKPDATTAGPGGRNEVYFWIVPAKVAGAWDARVTQRDGSERAYRLELTQNFQEIDGVARPAGARAGEAPSGTNANGQTLALVDARLTGDQISFSVIDKDNGQPMTARATGRVDGNTMSGTVKVEGGSPAELKWRATRVGR